jgi:tRNA dimethylallyltransferase
MHSRPLSLTRYLYYIGLLKTLVTIGGPTGSGKSTLALRVAEAFNGEIINCDSLQLYKGYDVGTAKIPEAGRRAIPHHLIDVLEPSQGYSAGDYARDARAAIAGISARGCLPVITGGTGFYLRAVLNGLPQLPGRDEPLRSRLAAKEARRPGSLHRLLSRLDPPAALRMHARDAQKVTRALEIRILTRGSAPPPSASEALKGYRVLKLALDPDRAILYKLLDARTLEMFRHGLIQEVEGLLAKGCNGAEKPFESLGYKQALAHLRGTMTLEEAIASTRMETRQYAKRQWTWFRRDPDMIPLQGFGDSPEVSARCLDLVRQFLERTNQP